MNEKQSKLEAGQIQFHQWCKPPLEQGKYIVEAKQTVAEIGDQEYDASFNFSVAGPRFTLNPADVYSVYPPKGQLGNYANSLPHVVFTRRTLPWERIVNASETRQANARPWMALLVLSEADFTDNKFPELKTSKLGELIKSEKEPNVARPDLILEEHESADGLCNTMTLPWDVFQKVAPKLADLEFLAHVREVNTGNKETMSLLADGWFSVVLANRFPQQQVTKTDPPEAVENRAYLVSLEGVIDFLPGGPKSGDSNIEQVKLVVLSSWNFHCYEAFEFKASMKKLEVELLRTPWTGDPILSSEAEEQVFNATHLGYTALNHSTRLGEKAVSWYRGPLVPLYISKESKYKFYPAADAAMRYSPLDGMMDVTYAAAFQLGRLLALQDRHFASSLYAYRSGVRRQMNEIKTREKLTSLLGSSGTEESKVMESYLQGMNVNEKGDEKETSWSTLRGSEVPSEQTSKNKSQAAELKLTTDIDFTVPQAVSQWLARLILLYRVPFTNLVADERMLPPDSMRFFYLDPGWLKCLLEGACSVGRSSARDELVDEYLRDKFLNFAFEQAQEVRTGLQKSDAQQTQSIKTNSQGNPSVVTTEKPHGLTTNDNIVISGVSSTDASINGNHTVTVIDSTTFSVPMNLDAGTGGSFVRSKPNWPLTGFLLRSPVVDGWQGLEMRAWSDSGENAKHRLKPLRIDRLAPDIMLIIFNGKVDRIEVMQPPEGMHFGAAIDGEGFKRHSLRRLKASHSVVSNTDKGSDKGEPADQLPESEVNIPLRSAKSRVVEVAELASLLEGKLKKLNAGREKGRFTSADFGVEMVESPGRIVFDVNAKEKWSER